MKRGHALKSRNMLLDLDEIGGAGQTVTILNIRNIDDEKTNERGHAHRIDDLPCNPEKHRGLQKREGEQIRLGPNARRRMEPRYLVEFLVDERQWDGAPRLGPTEFTSEVKRPADILGRSVSWNGSGEKGRKRANY